MSSSSQIDNTSTPTAQDLAFLAKLDAMEMTHDEPREVTSGHQNGAPFCVGDRIVVGPSITKYAKEPGTVLSITPETDQVQVKLCAGGHIFTKDSSCFYKNNVPEPDWSTRPHRDAPRAQQDAWEEAMEVHLVAWRKAMNAQHDEHIQLATQRATAHEP